MQDARTELNRVKQARRIVEKVRGRLMHPTIQAMDRGAAELSAAAECLANLESALRRSGRELHWPGVEAELARLRLEMRNVQQLVEGAGRFYVGWARLIAPDQAPANYAANGRVEQPAPVAAGEVVLHG